MLEKIVNNVLKNKNFIDILKYFENKNDCKNDKYCLFSPKFGEAHHVLSSLVVGHTLRNIKNVNIAHIEYDRPETKLFKKVFDILGSENVEYGKFLYPIHNRIQSYVYYLYQLVKLYFFKVNIEKLSFNGLIVGDLLIDSYIRSSSSIFTIDSSTPQFRKVLHSSIRHYFACKNILNTKDYSYLFVVEKFLYAEGILSRLAIKKGIKVISEQFNNLSICENINDLQTSDFDIDEYVLQHLLDNNIKTISEYIKKRFIGESENYDVKLAFGNTVDNPSIDDIRESLELDPNKPTIVIMAHIFSDAPHSHRNMIYSDYYQWFIETLNISKELLEFNWLVKLHPSSELYGESNIVDDIISNYTNVKKVPLNISTTSIFEISDSLLTVRGTASLEGLLFNINPILTGSSSFSNLGLTINCTTEKEYVNEIKKIKFKEELPEIIKQRASVAIYTINVLGRRYSNIVPYKINVGLSFSTMIEYEEDSYGRAIKYLNNNSMGNDPYVKSIIKMLNLDLKRLPYI